MRQIFVTGGTGYVGTQLVETLLQEGESVKLLIMHESEKAGFEPSSQLEFVHGNVLDKTSLFKGMQGCNRIYHLAGYAKNFAKNPQVFFDINFHGAVNVIEAALAHGKIEKVVATSTVVTLGPTQSGQIGNEEMKRNTEKYFTSYEASKAKAEKILMEYATYLPIVQVNPTRVFGPGKMTEGNSMAKLMLDFYHHKMPFLLGQGEEIGNYVFVKDLVRGHILAMQHGKSGEKYILGGTNKSLKNFFHDLARSFSIDRFQLPIPKGVINTFAHIEEWRGKNFNYYPLITPGWVKTFSHHWAFTSDRAKRELGYEITPFEQALDVTVSWLKESLCVPKK